MSLATSTSAKALQRPAADKAVYLHDGSLLIAYWNGSNGQVAQVTSPLSSPSVTNLFTTAEDGVSLWADTSAGTSTDIWVASSDDDASGAGPAIHIRHGTYNGSSFTWDTSTSVPGSTQADTIQCSVTWNGTYLMAFWWDGASGTDRVAYNWTTDKSGQTGWLAAAYAAVFSESSAWSTISQVVARHSANLGATIVVYSGNSAMHYGCMPDSASSGPKTGATLSGTSAWSGSTTSSVSAGVIAAVKPSGSTPAAPVGTPSLVQATSGSITSSWGTGQNRTAGNLLVAVVGATGTTSAATISTPSGWTQQLTAGGATKATVALYTKTAAGSDAAPAFTSTISGTATMDVALLELANASTSSPVDASGTATASASGVTVTTSGNIATNGDFAVAGFSRERAATTATYTPAVGWANLVNDGATSSTGHFAVDARGGPDITRWGGRATYDSFTDSYGFGGPALVVDEANGNIHCVKASPNVGGPTWTGIVYWLGTYNGSSTNTVTWGTRVSVDSTSTTTGPPDVTVAVDINGKVYVPWITDQSAGSMKYSTLVSPYTSATAGGTISTGGSTPRYPHCPPLSKGGAGLDTALPVLYMDATSTPFPVNLDTSVTLPSGGVTASAGLASGAGTAPQPGVTAAANAGLASGSAAAPAPAMGVTPGTAHGTGTAQGPSVTGTVPAGLASGTGTSSRPVTSAAAPGSLAAGAGAAPAAAPGAGGAAGLPAGTGTARPATVAGVPGAGAATAAGAALAPAPAVTAAAGLSAAAGAALQPSASTSGNANASAGLAAGAGAAQAPAAAVIFPARLASGTGAALAPALAAAAQAAAAQALASALDAAGAAAAPFTVGILAPGTQSGVNAAATYAPTGATSTSSGVNASSTSP